MLVWLSVAERFRRDEPRIEWDARVEALFARRLEGNFGDDWRRSTASSSLSDYEEALQAISSAPRSVVFINRRPSLTSAREALHLGKHGWQATLLHLHRIPDSMRGYFDRSFIRTIQLPDDFQFLQKIVGRLKCDVLHVLNWMMDLAMGVAILRAPGRTAPVINEFNDLTSVFATEANLVARFGRDQASLDLACEGVLLRESNLVLTRFGPEVHPLLDHLHGHDDDGLAAIEKFWPRPNLGDFVTRSSVALGSPIRLVYAGGVPGIGEGHANISYPGDGLLPAIQRICGQGLHFDVVHDPYRPIERDPMIQKVRAYEGAFANFRVIDGQAPNRVGAQLSRYDFGTILPELPVDDMLCRPELLEYGIGTKFFGYLEAGLPMLISQAYARMGRELVEHGLGLPVPTNDIDKLESLLHSVDYGRFREGVRAYVERFNMELEVERLIRLYEGL